DSVQSSDSDTALQRQVAELSGRVAELESSLSEDAIDDKLSSLLQLMSRDMSQWASELNLEHSEWPVAFDLKNLTVVVHRDVGPIRLSQMGSGENWMGYHVLTHLALHKIFIEGRRP